MCVQAGRGLALPGTASPSLRPFYPAGWICPFLPVNHVAAMCSLLPPGAKPLNRTYILITALKQPVVCLRAYEQIYTIASVYAHVYSVF